MEGNCLIGKHSTLWEKTKYWGTKQQVNLIGREADPRGLKLEAEDGT